MGFNRSLYSPKKCTVASKSAYEVKVVRIMIIFLYYHNATRHRAHVHYQNHKESSFRPMLMKGILASLLHMQRVMSFCEKWRIQEVDLCPKMSQSLTKSWAK